MCMLHKTGLQYAHTAHPYALLGPLALLTHETCFTAEWPICITTYHSQQRSFPVFRRKPQLAANDVDGWTERCNVKGFFRECTHVSPGHLRHTLAHDHQVC